MLVLLIVGFSYISQRFLNFCVWHFLGIPFACSRYFLCMFSTFAWYCCEFSKHSYVCLTFSKDSVFSKASSSCLAGTGWLCCLLLHFHVFLSVPLSFLWHFLAFSCNFLCMFLTCAWNCCEFSYHFQICPIIFSGFQIFQGFSSCILYFLNMFLPFVGILLAFSMHVLGICLQVQQAGTQHTSKQVHNHNIEEQETPT